MHKSSQATILKFPFPKADVKFIRKWLSQSYSDSSPNVLLHYVIKCNVSHM